MWCIQVVLALLGPVVQSVASPIADPGVASSIPAAPLLSWIVIFYGHCPPTADSRKVLSVKSESMYLSTAKLSLPRKSVIR